MNSQMLKIELRRNTVLLLLPVLVGIVLLSPIARHLNPTALWPDRSTDMQGVLQALGPFFAGAAAWMASRERRSQMEDLLATTPGSSWIRMLTVWLATTLWGLLFYVALGIVFLSITATQATWGEPVLWPLLVGLLAIPALSALGFVIGHYFPGRLTAPLVAVGVFVVCGVGMAEATSGGTLGYLTPIYPAIGLGASVWYNVRPDIAIVQALFLLGLTIVGLGSLGLDRWRAASAISQRLAVIVTGAGIVLVVTSIALVSTATSDALGPEIPLLHNSASDTATPYTPVCSATPLPVCVHPAYSAQLDELATPVNRIAAPLIGLPAVPTCAEQLPTEQVGATAEYSCTLVISNFILDVPNPNPAFQKVWVGQVAIRLVANTCQCHDFERLPNTPTGKAQTAVALYLLNQAGVPFDPTMFDQSAEVKAAAQRFATLDPQTRQSWLRSHYPLLRQGQVRLEDLP